MSNPVGRPTKYGKQIATEICALLAEGYPLTQICKRKGMPSIQVVYLWLTQEDKKEFLDMYTRARQDQADTLADEIITIADDSEADTMFIRQHGEEIAVENKEWINRSRLRVDARKWVAAKLKPRKYADKIEMETKNETTIKGDMTITLNLNEDNVQPPTPNQLPKEDS